MSSVVMSPVTDIVARVLLVLGKYLTSAIAGLAKKGAANSATTTAVKQRLMAIGRTHDTMRYDTEVFTRLAMWKLTFKFITLPSPTAWEMQNALVRLDPACVSHLSDLSAFGGFHKMF